MRPVGKLPALRCGNVDVARFGAPAPQTGPAEISYRSQANAVMLIRPTAAGRGI